MAAQTVSVTAEMMRQKFLVHCKLRTFASAMAFVQTCLELARKDGTQIYIEGKTADWHSSIKIDSAGIVIAKKRDAQGRRNILLFHFSNKDHSKAKSSEELMKFIAYQKDMENFWNCLPYFLSGFEDAQTEISITPDIP
ncbi:hypothetical protein KKC32_00620 [Patescibacteria group bacterium]|nr:hypothetical protein [Patescibacteria group bacterium]